MDTPISPFKFQRMSWMLTLRDLFRSPEEIMGEVDIQPGYRVLDYGCGTGSFTFEAAQRVGPEGKVYALDVHPQALEKVQKGALKKGLVNVENVSPRWTLAPSMWSCFITSSIGSRIPIVSSGNCTAF